MQLILASEKKQQKNIYIIHRNSFPFQTSIGWRVKLISYLSLQNRCRNGSFEPEALQVSDTGSFSQIWAATWQNQQNECAPCEDSDQPGHPPSLIRVFAVRMKKAWVLSYPLSAQQRPWSDWVDAQADLSLLGVHTFCWFCHVKAHIPAALIFVNTSECGYACCFPIL